MQKTLITKEIQAWQWNGETEDLPDGFFPCRPEVHYSAGRKYVYFTYADLRCGHWISASELADAPESPFMGGIIKTERKDGTVYFREVLPFNFWSIKSEASIKGDHTAKFLNKEDTAEVASFLDFASVEKWGSKEDSDLVLPKRLEFREMSGQYGRGYRPYYLKPTEWLIKDGKEYMVLSDEDFKAMLVEAGL